MTLMEILTPQEAYRESRRQYREANKGSILAKKRAYYLANRDKIRAKVKSYREANRELVLAQKRAWSKNRDKIAESKRQRARYEANKEEIKERSRQYYRQVEEALRVANPAKGLWKDAKVRAKQRGIPFDLGIEDISVPAVCPVLGIAIVPTTGYGTRARGSGASPNAPSLDRINPKLGYVRGNVQVISWRANRLKSDATPDELRLLADFMQRRDG